MIASFVYCLFDLLTAFPAPADGLETEISQGFDRLNQNVGAAFSAYSGVLKMAVAALDKTEDGLDEPIRDNAAPRAASTSLAH